MTTDLSLILQTKRVQKQFPLSIFVFVDSLVVSALQDAMQFPAKITSSCIWVAIPQLIELFYIGMPVVWTDNNHDVIGILLVYYLIH